MWQQGIWASSGFQEDVTPAGYPGFPSQAFHEFQSHSKGGGVQRSPISPGQHRILHVCSLRLGGRQVWRLGHNDGPTMMPLSRRQHTDTHL
jgi:hypothetical protein